jgi:5-methylcytosine-specific restriction endonuclease McrA
MQFKKYNIQETNIGGKIKRICVVCGKNFFVYPYLVKKGYGKVCSKECRYIWLSKQLKGDKNSRYNRVERICEICSKTFYVVPSVIKVGKGRFCSKNCANKWQSIYRKRENNPTWKGGGVKMSCIICGKEFIAGLWEVKDGRKYCSIKCTEKGRVKFYKKENHYNWKGGITKTVERIRKNFKYSDWRLKVYERDKFICQKCGAKGGYLHAHHIKPFSQILEELRQQYPLLDLYDIAMMSKELWDINNGITLCEKCHKELHKKDKRE